MNDTQAKKLREPFPAALIGQLPKGGIMLDFVGHAAVTDRLLQVDPDWTWEPVGVDANGLPAFDGHGNLWIRLTIAGVTRLGVGDGKTAKECISDAIRNAAMRFGVALDLWSKQDLDAGEDKPAGNRPRNSPQPEKPAPDTTETETVLLALVLAKNGDVEVARADIEKNRGTPGFAQYLADSKAWWEAHEAPTAGFEIPLSPADRKKAAA